MRKKAEPISPERSNGARRAAPAPCFFASPAEFRSWLAEHHSTAAELWVGFHKKATGRPSLTWPESVDEALCFGWIDGLRRSLGPDSYVIRFTPRKATSIWSAVNVRRMAALTADGHVHPAGRAAFERRTAAKTGIYSFEQLHSVELGSRFERQFRSRPAAWAFFASQPPGYRKTVVWWVVSAKREETRQRRLDTLIEFSANRQRIPRFTGPSTAK